MTDSPQPDDIATVVVASNVLTPVNAALSFKLGRYSLDIRDGAVAVMCADCTEPLAFHADPVGFDELAEDVWRHEKEHAHD